jgi:ubiquinone/menaquinone biosynthesis C-methylase UbiE
VIETRSHTTFPEATTPAGPFAWACPICRSALSMEADGADCTACGAPYERRDGIAHFLPAPRAAVLAPFIEQYETVRRHEGWGRPDGAYYRALPDVPPDDPNRAIWSLRQRTFRTFLDRVLAPLEAPAARPLRVVDLGAGNGWLAYRLARRGHYVAAVDLKTDAMDGLGACRHYDAPLWPVRAEFDRLPFGEAQFDLAVFNGSIHYTADYASTLEEALRVVRPGGPVVLLDSPCYPDAESGQQMVREREARFIETFGFASDGLDRESFLTESRMDELATLLGLRWERHTPFYGWRRMLGPGLARLRGRRAPASFALLVGWPTAVRPPPRRPRFRKLAQSRAWDRLRRMVPGRRARALIRRIVPGRELGRRLRRIITGRPARLPELPPRQGYDRWAPGYGEGMNPVQVLEAEALARLLPDLDGRRVLDIGCGTGRVCRLALERGAGDVVGLDLSDAMLAEAAAATTAPPVQWVQGDVVSLPFPAASFDAVTAALAMGHVADLDVALGEISRVLRPGGVLVLSDFHPFSTLRGWERTFVDEAVGRAYAIEQHLHLFADYVRCFSRLGLAMEALDEPCYEGFPLVFVLRARKQNP